MRFAATLALLLLSCATDPGARDRGAAGLGERVPEYPAPAQSRCAKFSTGSSMGKACAEAKYLAEIYVRQLSVGDAVCLDSGFGDPVNGGCPARAAVVDLNVGRLLLEVRQARPESPWFDKVQHQGWFEEGALVDLYLRDHGY